MPRIVALLRGINVGGHRRVPMADLRALAEKAGFRDVATYIQSGNVVFTAGGGAGAAGLKLEAAIEMKFGFPVDIVARTAAEWARYAAENPLLTASNKEPNRVMLVLSKAPPAAGAVAALAARATAGEKLKAAGDAVWIHYPCGAGTSKLAGALVDRLLGSPSTARNWTTVLALQALLAGDRPA
ncbi:MAG: DUF1697 domain-containing protein [Planctomycetes bacterium]|nr:DUF1697 domain-containing protein [Planctomycetota bacterium]